MVNTCLRKLVDVFYRNKESKEGRRDGMKEGRRGGRNELLKEQRK